MADLFDELCNENTEREEVREVELRIVSVGKCLKIKANAGTTIGEILEDNELGDGVKITDRQGNVLDEDYEVDENMDLFLSVPKKNG